MGLAGLPIIIFYQGDKKYNFLLDSGSNVSYINASSDIDRDTSIGNDSYVGSAGGGNACTVHNIKLYLEGQEYDHIFRATDLNGPFAEVKSSYGITLSGILGTDFFARYKYCLDFKELVCYVRK